MERSQPRRAVSVVLNVTEDGRVIIPAEAPSELGLAEPNHVSASLVEGEVVLDSLTAALRRAQAEVRRYVPEGALLSDELIAERRAEGERE